MKSLEDTYRDNIVLQLKLSFMMGALCVAGACITFVGIYLFFGIVSLTLPVMIDFAFHAAETITSNLGLL